MNNEHNRKFLLPSNEAEMKRTRIHNTAYVGTTPDHLHPQFLTPLYSASYYECLMSSREMVSYPESSNKELHCDCGNLIEYDDIEQNCAFPAYQTLLCNKCSRGHRIIVDGTLGKLIGAKLS